MAKIGNIPSEANNKGSLNETTPADQRSPDFNGPKTEEAMFDPKTKAYGRAEYPTKTGNVRRDR